MAAVKLERLERLMRTDKQKRFEYDFLKDAENLECWEDVVVGTERDGEQTFEVTRRTWLCSPRPRWTQTRSSAMSRPPKLHLTAASCRIRCSW